MSWFIPVLGSLATFRLSHLMTKERGRSPCSSVSATRCRADAVRPKNGSAALVLFIIGQRTCLSHPLGGRPSLELGLLDPTLAKVQLSLAPD